MNKALPLCIFILGTLGCSGAKVYPIKGTVTFDSKPVPKGVVWFDPDPSIKDAPQIFAYINDGSFNTAEDAKRVSDGLGGVRAGKYTIRIDAFDGQPGNELPLGKPLFNSMEFSTEKEFTGALEDFKIEIPRKR